VVHAGREGSRGRVEVLYLLGDEAGLFEIAGELYGLSEPGTRMARYEVGHEVLLFAEFFVDLVVPLFERLEDLVLRLSHRLEHLFGYMFRGHLELSAHMVAHEFDEEGFVGICHEIVEPDPGAYEDLLHPRNSPEPSQDREIVPMIDGEVFTG
jgi:hypothetical protein